MFQGRLEHALETYTPQNRVYHHFVLVLRKSARRIMRRVPNLRDLPRESLAEEKLKTSLRRKQFAYRRLLFQCLGSARHQVDNGLADIELAHQRFAYQHALYPIRL